MLYTTPADHFAARREVHPSQRQVHIQPVSQPLYVATCVSNPRRWASRYRLYQAFEKHVADSGAILYTVELALRDRHHEVTSHDNPRHIQLRADSEMWHKENLLNLCVSRFPADWHYGSWVDADFAFVRPDWAVEAVHMLQHHRWCQMFSCYSDLDRHHQPYRTTPSFAAVLRDGNMPTLPLSAAPYSDGATGRPGGVQATIGATGGAWAFRREAFDAVGGLLDTCILGSGDWHAAFALAGKTNWAAETKRCTPGYIRSLARWAKRAEGERGSVGVVDGLALHYWHGHKANRAYGTRWSILQEHEFDPEVDLKRNSQGVYEWAGDKPRLEEAVRRYFASRDEDA